MALQRLAGPRGWPGIPDELGKKVGADDLTGPQRQGSHQGGATEPVDRAGLPVDDPVRFGSDRLLDAVLGAFTR